MKYKMIQIGKIKVDSSRAVDEKLVERLAESIEIIGLINPITITTDFELVAGRLRLEAYKLRGELSIPATIVTLDEMHRQIAAIDENLIRKRLTKLEEAEQLSERKKIYVALFPETRRGIAGAIAKHKGAKEKISFAADTADKTGQTERNINRKIAIFEGLHPDVRELVRDLPLANNLSELERLARHEYDTQIEFVELIKASKAKNISDALRLQNEPFKFSNTDKGKFQKAVKTAEKAFKQLMDDGLIKKIVEDVSEVDYAFYKGEVLADLETLKRLQEKLQVVIDFFEGKMRELETNTYVVEPAEQELALAE